MGTNSAVELITILISKVKKAYYFRSMILAVVGLLFPFRMLLVEEVRRGLYHLRLEKYIYSVEFKTSESGRKKVKKELVNHTFDLLGGGPLFQHSFTLSFQLTPKQPSSREQETLLHYYTDITNIELSMNVRQGTTSNPLVNRPIKILPVFVWAALDGNQADELFKMSETRWWRFNLHTKGKFNPLRLGLYIDYGGFPPSTSRGILDGKRTTLAHLAELFNSQSLCDVTFHLSDHEKETHVGAHRAILIARSPVFARMFEQAGMTEAQTGQVTVQDIRPAVFRQLLHYLYSGEAPKLEDDDVTIPLFIAADR